MLLGLPSKLSPHFRSWPALNAESPTAPLDRRWSGPGLKLIWAPPFPGGFSGGVMWDPFHLLGSCSVDQAVCRYPSDAWRFISCFSDSAPDVGGGKPMWWLTPGSMIGGGCCSILGSNGGTWLGFARGCSARPWGGGIGVPEEGIWPCPTCCPWAWRTCVDACHAAFSFTKSLRHSAMQSLMSFMNCIISCCICCLNISYSVDIPTWYVCWAWTSAALTPDFISDGKDFGMAPVPPTA